MFEVNFQTVPITWFFSVHSTFHLFNVFWNRSSSSLITSSCNIIEALCLIKKKIVMHIFNSWLHKVSTKLFAKWVAGTWLYFYSYFGSLLTDSHITFITIVKLYACLWNYLRDVEYVLKKQQQKAKRPRWYVVHIISCVTFVSNYLWCWFHLFFKELKVPKYNSLGLFSFNLTDLQNYVLNAFLHSAVDFKCYFIWIVLLDK